MALSFSVRDQMLTTCRVWSAHKLTTSDIAGVSGRQPGDKPVSPCLSPLPLWVTLRRRGPLREERTLMAEDRPAWARRMYNERKARGWSQADTIRALRAHSVK